MNRAVRWLLLVPLIVIGFVYYGEVVRAQTGNTVSIICSQYLRAEPEDGSSRVGLMNPGEAHAVLGRYGSWVYLQIDADLQGWAYDGICLTVNVDFETLPVLDPTQVGAVQAGPHPRDRHGSRVRRLPGPPGRGRRPLAATARRPGSFG